MVLAYLPLESAAELRSSKGRQPTWHGLCSTVRLCTQHQRRREHCRQPGGTRTHTRMPSRRTTMVLMGAACPVRTGLNTRRSYCAKSAWAATCASSSDSADTCVLPDIEVSWRLSAPSELPAAPK